MRYARSYAKSSSPIEGPLLAEKYKKFPANVQAAIATPEETRTPGQALLAGQVVRTVSVSSAEIDRAMKPADLETKEPPPGGNARSREAAPSTDSGRHGHHGWRLSVYTPTGRATSPRR
jgi:hypothetical protein